MFGVPRCFRKKKYEKAVAKRHERLADAAWFERSIKHRVKPRSEYRDWLVAYIEFTEMPYVRHSSPFIVACLRGQVKNGDAILLPLRDGSLFFVAKVERATVDSDNVPKDFRYGEDMWFCRMTHIKMERDRVWNLRNVVKY